MGSTPIHRGNKKRIHWVGWEGVSDRGAGENRKHDVTGLGKVWLEQRSWPVSRSRVNRSQVEQRIDEMYSDRR